MKTKILKVVSLVAVLAWLVYGVNWLGHYVIIIPASEYQVGSEMVIGNSPLAKAP